MFSPIGVLNCMEDVTPYKINPKNVALPIRSDIRQRLRDPETRDVALLEVAEWVKNTGLFFGASATTAYKVAAVFVEGLSKDYSDK
jgi:hypothetical protein